MSLQRQQNQLQQIVNHGNRRQNIELISSSLIYSQSTAKLSNSLNPGPKSQSPNTKINQSHGMDTGHTKKKQNPQFMDFNVLGMKSNKQSLVLNNSNIIQNNRYQMELLKLMTSNQLRTTTTRKSQIYMNDLQSEALNNAKKMVNESIRGMTPKNYQPLNKSNSKVNGSTMNQSNSYGAHTTEEKYKLFKQSDSNNNSGTIIKTQPFEKRGSINTKIQEYHLDRKLVKPKSIRPSFNQGNFNNLSMQQQQITGKIKQSSAKRFFSNERIKTGSNISSELEAIIPIENFTVIFNYEQQNITFKIDATKTTDWLEQYFISEVKKLSHHPSFSGFQADYDVSKTLKTEQPKTSLKSDPQMIALTSVDRNFPLDYYLQLKGRSLMVFKDQTLKLQPLYNEDENPKIHRICLKDFKFLKCIGVGGFSRVYLVKRKSTGRMFAMKLIDKEFILKNKKQGIVQNERDIMTVLDHPFISKLEHSFESHNFIVFVMEFCSGGELFWQLRQVKKMQEDQAKFYFTEICLGMLYLHSLNVVYRDIKPENILIDIDGHVRIADFGLSKPNMGEDDYAYSFCGSPEYMAPEMLLKTGHNVQVDHYCLGALLYELVTGLPPYYSQDTEQIYDSILNEELTFPEKCHLSPEIKHLLSGLLNKHPLDRLGYEGGLSELLVHPWFKGINFVAILDKQVQPPFKPNQLKFHFDSNELTKGELEAREKLMGRTGFVQEVSLFQSFYFDQNEQKQMKIEQKRIFQQHRAFISQQQSKFQAKSQQQIQHQTKMLANEGKQTAHQKKPTQDQDKLFKPQTSQENIKMKTVLSVASQSQLKKGIIQQYMSGGPSPQNSTYTTQGKVSGLKRITSQNNFFHDHQMMLPGGAYSRGDDSAAEFSLLAEKYKNIVTEQTEKQIQKLFQENGHKRVSSLKQKTK